MEFVNVEEEDVEGSDDEEYIEWLWLLPVKLPLVVVEVLAVSSLWGSCAIPCVGLEVRMLSLGGFLVLVVLLVKLDRGWRG